MKPDKDVTVARILEDMLSMGLDGRQSDLRRTDESGTFQPVSREEQLETEEKLRASAAEAATKIQTVCIACRKQTPLLASTPCECGGFVCTVCRAQEGDEECLHVLPPEIQALHDQED